MPEPEIEARAVKAWDDQDIAEAFLLVGTADQNRTLDQAVLAEMQRRALGGQNNASHYVQRPRLWDFGQDG